MYNGFRKQPVPAGDDTDMADIRNLINNLDRMEDESGTGPSRLFPAQLHFQQALYGSITDQPVNDEQFNDSDYMCEDADEADDDVDEDYVINNKGKGKARAKTTSNGFAEDDEEEQASDPKGKGKAKRPRRNAEGYEEGVRGAPPANTDLPWHALDGITDEEMLAYFPNHSVKWPGMAARLMEDGWSPSRIARYINKCWSFTTGEEDTVLANTIGISMNGACAQFYGDANYTTSTAVKQMQHRTTQETAEAKQLLMSTAWKPCESKRYTTTLEPAWSLQKIAQVYVDNHQSFPTTGIFTSLLSATLLPNNTNAPLANSSHAHNPPRLPFGWTSAWPKETKTKQRQSPVTGADDEPMDAENTDATTKKRMPPKGNLKLQTRGHRLNRADLPKEIRDDPEAIIEKYQNELSGEILLYILSKHGGKYSCTSLKRYYDKKYGAGKVVDRSTFAKRKEAALKERAADNNTTYKHELAVFQQNESWSKGQGGARARAKKGKTAVKQTVSKKTLIHVEDDDDDEDADFRPSTRRMTRSMNADQALTSPTTLTTLAPLVAFNERTNATEQVSGSSSPPENEPEHSNMYGDDSIGPVFDFEPANNDLSTVGNVQFEDVNQPTAVYWPGTDVSIDEPCPWDPVEFFPSSPPTQQFVNTTAMDTSLPNMAQPANFEAAASTVPYQFIDGSELHDETMDYNPFMMNTPELLQSMNNDIAQWLPTNNTALHSNPTNEIASHPLFANIGLDLTTPYQTQADQAAHHQNADITMTDESDSEGDLPIPYSHGLGVALPAAEFDEHFQLQNPNTTPPTSEQIQRMVSMGNVDTSAVVWNSSPPGWGNGAMGETQGQEGVDVGELFENDW